MSHRVHPKVIKIRETKDWLSRGFYQRNFPQLLQEDFLIRSFLEKKLAQASVESLEIERTVSNLKVIIKTARPALVIGRGGKAVEDLKQGLETILRKSKNGKEGAKKDIKIEILEVREPWQSAGLVAQWMAGQLEKMVPFRRVLKMALSKMIGQREIKGAKVEVAGRLNGVEISRTEWLKEGRLPRQTLRAVIDYGTARAYCTYGVIGVKVWIYKGERFN
ncbi:MAG: 30S ribosomal protein S3 [Patescibacteria group bacterium]|nr:30S ribosomal protein S3 [Patescibacteria group bacterium]